MYYLVVFLRFLCVPLRFFCLRVPARFLYLRVPRLPPVAFLLNSPDIIDEDLGLASATATAFGTLN
jgi:hypothetical protein